MIKETTLGEIYINTEKDGKPLVSKSGRQYTMVVIKVGENKASMYCDNEWSKSNIAAAKGWKPGDKILLNFERNGDFWNFSIPRKTDLLEDRITKLEERVASLEDLMA